MSVCKGNAGDTGIGFWRDSARPVRGRSSPCLWVALLALALAGGAVRAQGVEGTFLLVGDSDGSKPHADASVTLTFRGGVRGSLSMAAEQPGETVTDSGTFSTAAGRITIKF